MFARLQNRDLRILSANVDWQLDAATDFNVSVLLQEVPDIRSVRMSDIGLYSDGELVVSGFVTDEPEFELDENQVLVARINGFGDLGWITRYRAKANSHYQDQTVLSILTDLLLATGGTWEIGDSSTMVDGDITTTIDLRQKEELFAQVVATIKSVPDVHIRYGGIVNGVHQLDIGNFNTETHRFFRGRNLLELRRKRVSKPSYTVVEAYGSQAGVSSRVTLQDALADPRTTAHADYTRFPITQDATTGAWIVTDQDNPGQGEVTKFFNLNKTKNDEAPTASEVAETGYALWLKTVRFLKSNGPHESYTAQVMSRTAPKVGDRAYLQASIVEPVLDRLTHQVDYLPLFELEDSLRISKVEFDFEQSIVIDREGLRVDDENLNLYSLEVSSNDESEILDPDLEVYERVEPAQTFDQDDKTLGFQVPPPVTVTYSDTDPADCVYTGPSNDGKEFILTSPDPPNWANSVSVSYSADPFDAKIKVTQQPASPGQDLILCVQPPSGSWPGVGVTVSITAQYVFTK